MVSPFSFQRPPNCTYKETAIPHHGQQHPTYRVWPFDGLSPASLLIPRSLPCSHFLCMICPSACCAFFSSFSSCRFNFHAVLLGDDMS